MPDILVVDNERVLADMVSLLLRRRGHRVTVHTDVISAREHVRYRPCDLVITDLRMKGIDGDELVAALARERNAPPIIVMTAETDLDVLGPLVNHGVCAVLTKPFEGATLICATEIAIRHHSELRELREATHEADGMHGRRLDTVMRALRERDQQIEVQRLETDSLAAAIARSIDARGVSHSRHVERFAVLMTAIAKEYGLPGDQVELIRRAAPWHDVGMMVVPERAFVESGPLTIEERTALRQHPSVGYHILREARISGLMLAAEIAFTHHERWDGLGYPRGLRGNEIPLTGRIAAIADAFDAMVSPRHYRESIDFDQATEEIRLGAGSQFDPAVVECFLSRLPDVAELMHRFRDPDA